MHRTHNLTELVEEDSVSATTQKKKWANLQPFIVELGDANNRSIQIASLREVFRGTWSIQTLQKRKGIGGRHLGEHMQRMPDIPGIRIEFKKGMKVRVFDPLEDDKDLVEEINRVLRKARAATAGGRQVTFVEEKVHELEADEFKTFVHEIMVALKSERCKLVKGEPPANLEDWEGRILYDLMNSSQTKPRYVDDVSEWLRDLDRA